MSSPGKSTMCSPGKSTKSPKKTLPPIIGYIHDLSRISSRNIITSLSVVSSETESGSFVNVKGKRIKGATEETVGKNNREY
jgi:hypothetical protein